MPDREVGNYEVLRSCISPARNGLWLDAINGPVRNYIHKTDGLSGARFSAALASLIQGVPERAGSSDGMNPAAATKTLLLQKERVVRLLKRVARDVEDEETRPKKAKIIELCTRHTLTACKRSIICYLLKTIGLVATCFSFGLSPQARNGFGAS